MWLTLKLALRYALGQPARTLVTALGVAAGVAGLRAIELGTQGALDSVKTAYEQAAGQASLVVVPAGDTLAPLPSGTYPRLAAMEGVEAALPLLQQQTVRKVPLFGDIPLLGWLFKARENFETGRELVVFLTPSLVKSEGALAARPAAGK